MPDSAADSLSTMTVTPLSATTWTVPGPSSAVIVTALVTTRFSVYRPGPTRITAPSRASATASPMLRYPWPGAWETTTTF